MIMSLLLANTAQPVQKNDVREFVDTIAKDDAVTGQKVVSVGEVF
jgi:hypothetical protein